MTASDYISHYRIVKQIMSAKSLLDLEALEENLVMGGLYSKDMQLLFIKRNSQLTESGCAK